MPLVLDSDPINNSDYKFRVEIFAMLFIFSFVFYLIYLRSEWLFALPWPLDYDGFYYLQEIKQRLETGEGYYHQHSIFFFVLTLFASITGFELTQTLNFWIIGCLGLFSLGLAFLAWDKNNPLNSLVLASLPWISDISWYLAYGFLKQLGAVGFIVLGFSLLMKFRSTISIAIIGIILCALGALFHVFGILLASVLLLTQLNFSKRQRPLAWLFFIIGTSLILFTYIQHPASNHFQPNTNWIWNQLVERGFISRAEFWESILFFLTGIILIILLLLKVRTNYKLCFLAALWVIAALPLWDIQFGAYGYRIARTSIWIFFIFFALAVMPSMNSVVDRVKSSYLAFSVFSLLAFIQIALPHSPHPIGLNKPLILNPDIASELKAWLPEDGVIITSHGYQYALTYFADVKAQNSLPKTDFKKVYTLQPKVTSAQCRMVNCFDLENGMVIRGIN